MYNGPVYSPCDITLVGEGIKGEITLPCDWNAVMGDETFEVNEFIRIADVLVDKTGLWVGCMHFNYSTGTAMVQVGERKK